jgi:predicted transport protein
MTTPKHTKITTYEVLEDGGIKAVTESYFEELASRKEDIIQNVKTNHNDFMADLLSCTDVIQKQQTRELHLRITVDEWNKPNMIIKQYTTHKDSYKRR